MNKDAQVALREFIDMIRDMSDEELKIFLLDCRSELSDKELEFLNKATKAIKESGI